MPTKWMNNYMRKMMSNMRKKDDDSLKDLNKNNNSYGHTKSAFNKISGFSLTYKLKVTYYSIIYKDSIIFKLN